MTLLKAADLFDGLKPEKKQPEQKDFKVEISPGLEKIIESFEIVYESEDNKGIYDITLDNLPSGYTAQEIYAFSLLLPKFQERDSFDMIAGVFLSTIIKHCRETEIKLHTDHLEKPLGHLGMKNKDKHIIIYGDPGYFLGNDMEGGRITAHGSVIAATIGPDFKGGEIHIEGEKLIIEKLYMQGGLLYHKGVLVAKDGIIVNPKYK